MKLYVVLFKDGSMMPTRVEPEKIAYQEGARFFQVDDRKDLCRLSYWYAMNNDLPDFKEIKGVT